MINNPERGIKTDWAVQDIVKPANMNALTGTVPYDFIITKERVDAYRTEHPNEEFMDVGTLIWEGYETSPDYSCGGRKAIHILLNFATTIGDKFNFGGQLTMVASNGVEEVHIHSLSSYCACGTALNIYYHTSGTDNYVLFSDTEFFYRGADLHVGSFGTNDPLFWPNPQNGHTFIYEKLLSGQLPSTDGVPTPCVRQEMWLTNTKEAATSPIIDCSSDRIYFNSEQNVFCWGSGTSSEILSLGSSPSASAQAAVGSIISKIDDVLSTGLVPVLKFRQVDQEYCTDFEYYLPMVRRGCCGFFFIWPRQRIDNRTVYDTTATPIGSISILEDLPVFIGSLRGFDENFYSIGLGAGFVPL